MQPPSFVAAELLETSAPAYAAYAASLLLERHPEVEARFAPTAMRDWKASLTQRVLELSAALEMEERRLFVLRVRWAEKAFRVRNMPPEDCRSSLVCLREVLEEELPEAAGREAGEWVDQALRDLAETPATARSGLDPEAASGRLALRYLKEILEGNAQEAIDLVVAAVDEGLDPRAAYLEVLVPAQREIGEMWHLGEISVGEEHFVTSTTERAMSILVRQTERRAANGKTVISAAVAGNAHGLATRVVADFFEMAGWRAVCLGADVPVSELAAAAQSFDADLAVLSAAHTTQLKTVRLSIEALRRVEDREVKILVGGVAFAEVPELWRRLGADGHAGPADEAVDLGARLVGLAPADGEL